jgi:hypothetical protein
MMHLQASRRTGMSIRWLCSSTLSLFVCRNRTALQYPFHFHPFPKARTIIYPKFTMMTLFLVSFERVFLPASQIRAGELQQNPDNRKFRRKTTMQPITRAEAQGSQETLEPVAKPLAGPFWSNKQRNKSSNHLPKGGTS